ncbi:MAG: hypothetical protein ABIX28_16045 [Vicinamibacterales bacterium]
MPSSPVSEDRVLGQLAKLLESSAFANAERARSLLKFVVEEAVGGRLDRLKEYTIGAEALGKGDSFDPRTDPIVRAEASRLRGRLERYYASDGLTDPIVVILPKGGYVPRFQERSAAVDPAPPAAGPSAPPGSRWHERLPWLLLAVAVVGGALAVWLSRTPVPSSDAAPMDFEVELASSGTLGSDVGTDVVISPDGRRLVYVVRGADGVTRLQTRRLETRSSRTIGRSR